MCPGEHGVALLVGEEHAGGDEEGLDGLAAPPLLLGLRRHVRGHLQAQPQPLRVVAQAPDVVPPGVKEGQRVVLYVLFH